MSTDAEKNFDALVIWAREHRSATPGAGNLRDPRLMASLLRAIGAGVLDDTAPADVPERIELWADGIHKVAGRPAPPFDPVTANRTATELATLIGFLEDAG